MKLLSMLKKKVKRVLDNVSSSNKSNKFLPFIFRWLLLDYFPCWQYFCKHLKSFCNVWKIVSLITETREPRHRC